MPNILKHLFIHTTATPKGRWVSKEDIIRWHTAPPPYGYGWRVAGYNYVVLLHGQQPVVPNDFLVDNPECIIRVIRPINFDNIMQPNEIVFHAGPAYNPNSHAICYVGGMSADMTRPEDTRTPDQIQAMNTFIRYFISKMEELGHQFTILGHNQVDNKACPSFFVPCYLRSIGVNSRYIDNRDPFGYRNYFARLYRNPCYGAVL
ncbi:MAG: lysozyme [Thermoplasmata archaeon]